MSDLKNEFDNDPLARGYVGMTDEQAVVSLNTKNRPVTEALSVEDLIMWGSRQARLTKLADAAASGSAVSPGERAEAIAFMQLMALGANFSDTRPAALLTALVASGVLSAGDKTSLANLAGNLQSRALELRRAGARIPSPVRTGDVTAARI